VEVPALYANSAIRIVLTSGYTSPAPLADIGRACRFVPKPYRIDTVVRLLRS